MVFERYYAAGLGRFRFSATTDPREVKAREIPFELEPILLMDDKVRTPDQIDRLRDYYLSVAPELAKARAAIDKLASEIPEDPITLVHDGAACGQPTPDVSCITAASFCSRRTVSSRRCCRCCPG